MANRTRGANNIRGPHSALTDFLASNNISAHEIHQDYQRRVREAQQQAQQEGGEQDEGEEEHEEDESQNGETAEQKKKRKRRETATIARIKQSKEFARRKLKQPEDDDDELARDMMYQKVKPLPGQLDNCEICGKRFTVTAYSKAGPSGGLLCAKCSKEISEEEKKFKPKKAVTKKGRRQTQSNLLDGYVQPGALSLVDMCTKKVADNINDVEEFGDLPPQLLHRLSQILSKRRVLTSRTLNLFLRPELDSINIYDCGKLETDDFQKIFAFMPSLVRVDLRFAGQLKDGVIHYMLDRNLKIKHLQLDAANLISDASWQQLFTNLGKQLETLKLSNLDYAFTDETIDVLTRKCVNLRRLKLTECWKLGEASINAISRLPKLEHLTLNFITEVQSECLVQMVQILGPNLRTLSLTGFHNADDRLLAAIHAYCQRLQKFRLTDNSVCTDKGYLNLFQGWINPPLEFIDLSATRDVDNAHPDGPEEPVGLASRGLLALLRHSGSTVQTLNISSCRHISHAAFEEAFQRDTVYPHLHSFDVSFHTTMDDFLIAAIFRSCPAIKKVIAFACFKVRDVRVPTGVALIGGLRVQDSIVMEVDYMDNLALSHRV